MRMHTTLLSLSTKECNTLVNRSDVDVSNLNSLIIIKLQFFSNNLWWPFYCKTFLWAAAFASIYWPSHSTLLLLIFLNTHSIILTTKKVQTSTNRTLVLGSFAWVCLLKSFINFHWGEKLSLGEQSINLFDKFKGCILLIQYQSINIINNNWNLSSLEEKLKQLPVISLFLIIFSIFETVHLNFLREVSRKHFSN
jgi:hypothetical protein